MPSVRRWVMVLAIPFAIPVVAAPSVAIAQYEAPPPIAVPTSEVKQKTEPIPQITTPVPQTPPPPPKPAPKAAPKPAAPPPPPKKKDEAKKEDGKDDKDKEPKTPVYNNEGVFKVSGGGGGAKSSGAKGTVAKAAVKKGSSAIVAEWPGFRMTDGGGSEVMVEFSKDPGTPTEHKAAGSITWVFKGAHVIRANNQNPLITLHFQTPVASVRLAPKKGELHVIVDLRPGANVAPTASGIRAPGDGEGKQFFVSFPAGNYLPEGGLPEGPAPTQKLKSKGDKADGAKDDKVKPEPPKPGGGGSKTGPKE